MTGWHNRPQCPFDVESTGIDVEADRIVTACVALVKPTPIPPWEVQSKSWLIDPGIDIPEGATAVHGITTVQAKEHGEQPGPALDLIAAELALALTAGVPIVGMNLAYDLTMLDRELRRHRLPTLPDRLDGRPLSPVVDVLVLDKQVEPRRRGSRKLVDLCAVYGVRIDGAHDSTFDAVAAARVAWRICQRYPAIGAMPLAELHKAQVRWRAEQQASLADYFRRIGKDASDVDGSWPMREMRPAVVEQEVLT